MSFDRIISEMSYWFYNSFSKTAMVQRPEIKDFEIEAISRKYAVEVHTKRSLSTFLLVGRMPVRYPKVKITVKGDNPVEVRACLRELILLFGRPDEVPLAIVPKKRAGRAILDDLLKQYPSR
jgi:hypothetical protein